MNKLYGLFIVHRADSFAQFVAASNDLSKIERMFMGRNIYVVNDLSDPTLLRQTDEGVYPMLLVRDVPYIC